MSSKSQGQTQGRILAFLWGFAFLGLFRYILNSLYPFGVNELSLSFFGSCLAFFMWLSFWRFFPRHLKGHKNTWLLPIFTFVNTGFFFFLFFYLSETIFLYSLPVIFSILLGVQMILFTSRLPLLLQYRVFLIAGMIPAALPFAELVPSWVIFSLSALPAIIPAQWLPVVHLPPLVRKTRLQPLRLSLDFLRFLFLAMSLYGLLDIYRDRFYPVAGIVLLGALVQQILLTKLQKKGHIKFGLIILSPILAVLGFLYYSLPLSFAAAIGYFMLSIWEAVYFKRAPEGYLKREQIIAGLVLLISLSLYFTSTSWAPIISGLIIIAVMVRMFFYLLGRYRQILALTFLLAIGVWCGATYFFYQGHVTREFFVLSGHRPKPLTYHSPEVFKIYPQDSQIFTNLYPQDLLDYLHQKNQFIEIQSLDVPPILLTMYFTWHKFKHKGTDLQNQSILFFPQFTMAYSTPDGRAALDTFLQWLADPSLQIADVKDGIPTIRNSASGEVIVLPQAGLINEAYNRFAAELASAYAKKGDYDTALSIVSELLTTSANDTALLMQAAYICGLAGQIGCQVNHLENYLKLSKDDNNDATDLLIELYYLQGNHEKAKALAEESLRKNPAKTLFYYRWIFKAMENEADPYKWQQFYYRVKNFNAKENTRNQQEKNLLIENIEEAIKANKRFQDILQEELKRQEFIQFPE